MNTAFLELRDKDLEEMALLLLGNDVGRDDYRRMVRWLKGGIVALGCEPDIMLDIMENLRGKPNYTQCALLKNAFYKWRVCIQHFIMDSEGNMATLAKGVVQMGMGDWADPR